jgi:hypothetical protein
MQYGKEPGPSRTGSLVEFGPRRVVIHLHKAAPAVANDQAGYEFQFRGKIVEVETYLGNTGSAAGPTTVDGKVSFAGAAAATIFSTVPSIAFNAATKRRRDAAGPVILPTGGAGNGVLTPVFGGPEAGVRVQPGDYYRVDVTGLSTGATDLSVYLHLVLEDS